MNHPGWNGVAFRRTRAILSWLDCLGLCIVFCQHMCFWLVVVGKKPSYPMWTLTACSQLSLPSPHQATIGFFWWKLLAPVFLAWPCGDSLYSWGIILRHLACGLISHKLKSWHLPMWWSWDCTISSSIQSTFRVVFTILEFAHLYKTYILGST